MRTCNVSIVVPIFNVEEYLSRCLGSLVNQTLKDIEIICVDDGSTDGSAEILKKYADRYSSVRLIHQRNKGLSAARNTGMKYARGDYIGFVDGDDWVSESMYEKLYKAIILDNADAAICNIICYSNKRNKYYKDAVFYHSNINVDYGVTFRPRDVGCGIMKSSVSVCNKIYSADYLRSNNLKFERGYRYEDYLFSMDVFLSANGMIYIEEREYVYRMDRADSFMGKNERGCFDIFHIGSEVIDRINAVDNLGGLQCCTLRDIYKRQHSLLRRTSGALQEKFYLGLIQFWKGNKIWQEWDGAWEILSKIGRLEKLGYQRWKRRDRLRAVCLQVLQSCNLDYPVKNLRHHIRRL